jgi:hypothetical protein
MLASEPPATRLGKSLRLPSDRDGAAVSQIATRLDAARELVHVTGDAVARITDEIGNVGIHQRVPDPYPFFAPTDNSGVVQNGKMLGHVLLNAVHSSRQLLNSRLAVTKLDQQLDSQRLAQDAEPFRDKVDEPIRFH